MDKSVTEFFMKMGKVPTVTAQERRAARIKQAQRKYAILNQKGV